MRRINYRNLQFGFEEKILPPKRRTYQDYLNYGRIVAETNDTHHEGVKGLWVLDVLPYAKHIRITVDAMHAQYNVCKDKLNVMKSKVGRKDNRSTSSNTLEACLSEGIEGNNFVLTNEECKEIDSCMTRVIG